MANWIRIFGTNDRTPTASDVVAHLLRVGFQVNSDVLGEDNDWEQVSLETPDMPAPVMLERTPLDDPGVTEEVKPLLDWLETVDDVLEVDEIEGVLRRTRQLFILGLPADAKDSRAAGRLSTALSRFLAQHCEGICEVDQDGFYDAKGNRLLEEGR